MRRRAVEAAVVACAAAWVAMAGEAGGAAVGALRGGEEPEAAADVEAQYAPPPHPDSKEAEKRLLEAHAEHVANGWRKHVGAGPLGLPRRDGYVRNGRIVPPQSGGAYANSLGQLHNAHGGLANFLAKVRGITEAHGGTLYDPALAPLPHTDALLRMENQVAANVDALTGGELKDLERREAAKSKAVKVA